MASIVETVAGDKRLQLGNEDFVRKMVIGTAWTKIRIGLRLALNDTGAELSNASFVLGVCQGTQYPFSSGSCTDFIGVKFGDALSLNSDTQLRYDSGSSIYVSRTLGTSAVTKVGSTLGIAALSAGSAYISLNPATIHSMFCIEILKGAGIYTLKAMTSDGRTDVSSDVFVSNLEYETVPTPKMSWYSSGTVAYTGSGLFDTLNIHWNKSVPTVEISDITVMQFS